MASAIVLSIPELVNAISVNLEGEEVVNFALVNKDVHESLLYYKRLQQEEWVRKGIWKVIDNIEAVKYLVEERNVRVDSVNMFCCPLTYACEKGCIQVVKYLVGKRIHAHYYDDILALASASGRGHLEVVKFFVEDRKVDVTADNNYAVRRACAGGHLELVKYLIEKGANIVNNGYEAIIPASGSGNLELVKYLVENGADVTVVDNEAIKTASIGGYLEIVKYLVEKGADVDSAIMHASEAGKLEVVKYLVENRSNEEIDNYCYVSARENGYDDVADYLGEVLGIEEEDD